MVEVYPFLQNLVGIVHASAIIVCDKLQRGAGGLVWQCCGGSVWGAVLYLEGQGDLLSIRTSPKTHMLTPITPTIIMNLVTRTPDHPSSDIKMAESSHEKGHFQYNSNILGCC